MFFCIKSHYSIKLLKHTHKIWPQGRNHHHRKINYSPQKINRRRHYVNESPGHYHLLSLPVTTCFTCKYRCTDRHMETDAHTITGPYIPHQYNLPLKCPVWSEAVVPSLPLFTSCPLYFLFCTEKKSVLCDLFWCVKCKKERNMQHKGKQNDLLCSCPWVTNTNLFVILHFYLVEYIKYLNLTVCLGLWLTLVLSLSHYLLSEHSDFRAQGTFTSHLAQWEARPQK